MSKVFPVDITTAVQIQSELAAITSYNDLNLSLTDLKIQGLKDEWAAKGYSRRDINQLVKEGLAELAKQFGN